MSVLQLFVRDVRAGGRSPAFAAHRSEPSSALAAYTKDSPLARFCLVIRHRDHAKDLLTIGHTTPIGSDHTTVGVRAKRYGSVSCLSPLSRLFSETELHRVSARAELPEPFVHCSIAVTVPAARFPYFHAATPPLSFLTTLFSTSLLTKKPLLTSLSSHSGD